MRTTKTSHRGIDVLFGQAAHTEFVLFVWSMVFLGILGVAARALWRQKVAILGTVAVALVVFGILGAWSIGLPFLLTGVFFSLATGSFYARKRAGDEQTVLETAVVVLIAVVGFVGALIILVFITN